MRLKVIACKVLLRELYTLAAKTENIVDIRWMKQALHDEPGALRTHLQRTINEVEAESEGYDAICLGFGLCSNGILGLKTRSMKLVVPRAHDCITLLLGSRATYKRMFEESGGGIYWYSRGWMEAGVAQSRAKNDAKYNEYVQKYGEDNAQYLMEMESNWLSEYKSATFIRWPGIESDYYENETKIIAEKSDLEFRAVEGTTVLLERLVDGDWNSADFLVLEPGQEIKASYKDDVIRA